MDIKTRQAVLDMNATKSQGGSVARIRNWMSGIFAVAFALMLFSMPVYAAEGIAGFFDEMKNILKQIYTGINSVMTAAAIVVVGIGFLIRIFSKNQRTVDEATTWIKRAIITWMCWTMLGLLLGTLEKAAPKGDSVDSYFGGSD